MSFFEEINVKEKNDVGKSLDKSRLNSNHPIILRNYPINEFIEAEITFDYLSTLNLDCEVNYGRNDNDFATYSDELLLDLVKLKYRYAIDKLNRAVQEEKSEYFIFNIDKETLSSIQVNKLPSVLNSSKEYFINFWAGFGTNVSPLHFDLSHHCLFVMQGKISLTLFRPYDGIFLYPFEKPNVSRCSQIRCLEETLSSSYPLLNCAEKINIDLHANDMIYIPSSWWYQLKSYDITTTLSYMFKPFIFSREQRINYFNTVKFLLDNNDYKAIAELFAGSSDISVSAIIKLFYEKDIYDLAAIYVFQAVASLYSKQQYIENSLPEKIILEALSKKTPCPIYPSIDLQSIYRNYHLVMNQCIAQVDLVKLKDHMQALENSSFELGWF